MRLQQITCGHFKADDGSVSNKFRINEWMNCLMFWTKQKVNVLYGPIGKMILNILLRP